MTAKEFSDKLPTTRNSQPVSGTERVVRLWGEDGLRGISGML